MNSIKNLNRLVIILILTLFVSIGYASIAGITLNINGGAYAHYESTLDVKFSALSSDIETSSICLSANGTTSDCATINASVTNDRTATFSVSGLKGYGDIAIVRYKIMNVSEDEAATLNISTTTNTDTEYFTVSTDLNNAQNQVVNSGNYAILTVKVKVNKVLYDMAQKTATITVNVNVSSTNN